MADTLSTVFAALGDPTRRRILKMLLEDDQAVTDIAAPFEMSLTAISKHLNILAAAGLVIHEKRGRIRWCGLSPDGLREASVWMAGFGQFEAVDLDGFERFLEQELTELPGNDAPDPKHFAKRLCGRARNHGEARRASADPPVAPKVRHV